MFTTAERLRELERQHAQAMEIQQEQYEKERREALEGQWKDAGMDNGINIFQGQLKLMLERGLNSSSGEVREATQRVMSAIDNSGIGDTYELISNPSAMRKMLHLLDSIPEQHDPYFKELVHDTHNAVNLIGITNEELTDAMHADTTNEPIRAEPDSFYDPMTGKTVYRIVDPETGEASYSDEQPEYHAALEMQTAVDNAHNHFEGLTDVASESSSGLTVK